MGPELSSSLLSKDMGVEVEAISIAVVNTMTTKHTRDQG